MNYYDDERKIIKDFQLIGNFGVYFPPQSQGAVNVFRSVCDTRKWMNWTYNAGKSDPPPDFFSDEYKLMMEVMRVDDHAFVNNKGCMINPVNMRESKLQKEIRGKIRESRPDADFNNIEIAVNVVTELSSDHDHNYRFYHTNFRWVLEKHIKKILLYRNNHPGKKLVFFVFDESTAYVQVDDPVLAKRGPIAGERFEATPVFHFMDKRLVDVFRYADIDYLIWFAPNKCFWGMPVRSPNVCVFDIKKCDFKQIVDYPEELIMSSEE